jgi:anti-sigma B factor antagonist
MTPKSELKQGVLVISLEGNLLGEHTNAPVMELLKSNIEGGKNKVLFNLADMKFINSTGLGMLMTALTKSRNAGGELALCNAPDQMKKLLQITKLETVFKVCGNESEAIDYLLAN